MGRKRRTNLSEENAISTNVSSVRPPRKVTNIGGAKDKMIPINSENEINNFRLKLNMLTNFLNSLNLYLEDL